MKFPNVRNPKACAKLTRDEYLALNVADLGKQVTELARQLYIENRKENRQWRAEELRSSLLLVLRQAQKEAAEVRTMKEARAHARASRPGRLEHIGHTVSRALSAVPRPKKATKKKATKKRATKKRATKKRATKKRATKKRATKKRATKKRATKGWWVRDTQYDGLVAGRYATELEARSALRDVIERYGRRTFVITSAPRSDQLDGFEPTGRYGRELG